MDNENVILGPLKEVFNNMGIQLISFGVTIVIAYVVTFLILRVVKVPAPLTKFISLMTTLIVMYYAYKQIFLA
ncbi:hypothetical protein ACFVR1_11355 [Psychrobacillus sp. NPDC058041]|uniref:hypothetical protein n=1 Tax=Psychrobacillus sp. NPDC058041 TaxID=3346310 RepID=UPI0036DE8C62